MGKTIEKMGPETFLDHARENPETFPRMGPSDIVQAYLELESENEAIIATAIEELNKPENKEKKNQIILSGGGTFLCKQNESGLLEPGADLEEAFEKAKIKLPETVNPIYVNLKGFEIDSVNMQFFHRVFFANTIKKIAHEAQNELSGFIGIHGTDSKFITGAYLPPLLGSGFTHSVGLTGAQESPFAEGVTDSDGKRNIEFTSLALLEATRVGVHETMLVTSGTAHRGSWVTGKKSRSDFHPYESFFENASGDLPWFQAPELIDCNNGSHAWNIEYPSHSIHRTDPQESDPINIQDLGKMGEYGNIQNIELDRTSASAITDVIQATNTLAMVVTLGASTAANDEAVLMATQAHKQGKIVIARLATPETDLSLSYDAGAKEIIEAGIPIFSGPEIGIIAELHTRLAQSGLITQLTEDPAGWGNILPPEHQAELKKVFKKMNLNYFGTLANKAPKNKLGIQRSKQ